jgi:hypothetical protein
LYLQASTRGAKATSNTTLCGVVFFVFAIYKKRALTKVREPKMAEVTKG